MNILYVTRWSPNRRGGGTEQRAWNHLEALRLVGDVHLLLTGPVACPLPSETSQRVSSVVYLADIVAKNSTRFASIRSPSWHHRLFARAWGVSGAVAALPPNEGEIIRAELPRIRFDVVFAFHLGSAIIADAVLPRPVRATRVIDWDFLESENTLAFAVGQHGRLSFPQRLAAEFNREKLKRAERKILSGWHLHLCCAPVDALWLRQEVPEGRCAVIPNAVQELPTPKGVPQDGVPTAIFVGTLAYWPNAEAALHLANDVWPRVRDLVANAQLIIVGRAPPESLKRIDGRSGISLIADAPTLSEYYERAWVALAPMQFSIGSTLKVLEAMAFARPVIGYAHVLGRHEVDSTSGVVPVTSPANMAYEIADLLTNPLRAQEMGARARTTIVHRFTADTIATNLAGIISGCVR